MEVEDIYGVYEANESCSHVGWVKRSEPNNGLGSRIIKFNFNFTLKLFKNTILYISIKKLVKRRG